KGGRGLYQRRRADGRRQRRTVVCGQPAGVAEALGHLPRGRRQRFKLLWARLRLSRQADRAPDAEPELPPRRYAAQQRRWAAVADPLDRAPEVLMVRRHAGFTLVEVLVALMVMALLAVMAWQGVDGILRTRQASQTRLDQVLRLNPVLARFEQYLHALHD